MSDQGEKTCPLCAKEMDLTDQQLEPCKCGLSMTRTEIKKGFKEPFLHHGLKSFGTRLCITFLASDVFFVVICVVVACVIGIAVCCYLPCIIAILYVVADQEGATKDDIDYLPKYKFRRIGDFEKQNGEIQESFSEIMTECNTDTPTEMVFPPEDVMELSFVNSFAVIIFISPAWTSGCTSMTHVPFASLIYRRTVIRVAMKKYKKASTLSRIADWLCASSSISSVLLVFHFSLLEPSPVQVEVDAF